MKTILCAILAAILFSSCAGQLIDISYEKQRLVNYKISDTLQVSIGDPIIDLENASVRNAYEGLFDYQTPSLGIFGAEQIMIKKGDRFTAVVRPKDDLNSVCIREEGPEKKFQLIHIFTDGRINSGWVLTNGQVPVQGSWTKERLFVKSSIPSKGENSFRAQIVYSGLLNNTVKAIYREYSNDLARPAFSQELQYDMNESKIISYKSIKIEIIKVTNSSIQYRVLEDGGLLWLPR